ncbi:hypothetical protein ACLB2K_038014 [Fragaria x ananassa]
MKVKRRDALPFRELLRFSNQISASGGEKQRVSPIIQWQVINGGYSKESDPLKRQRSRDPNRTKPPPAVALCGGEDFQWKKIDGSYSVNSEI